MSRDVEISLPDGTPVGHMVTKAVLEIVPGQPNRAYIELHAPTVIAQCMPQEVTLDMEADVEELRDLLRVMMQEEKDVAASALVLNKIQNAILMARHLITNKRNVWQGATLWQWCARFKVTDQAVINQAEKINLNDPSGLRVFPDGDAWMAMGPEFDGGPGGDTFKDGVAFGDSPAGAVAAYYKQYSETAKAVDLSGIYPIDSTGAQDSGKRGVFLVVPLPDGFELGHQVQLTGSVLVKEVPQEQ